jgi:hypothetical protein
MGSGGNEGEGSGKNNANGVLRDTLDIAIIGTTNHFILYTEVIS